LQTNLSYILLFCCLFFIKKGFSQDPNSKKKTAIATINKDSIFNSKKDSLGLKKTDTIALDSIKPKETIEDIIVHVATDYTIQNAKDKTVTLYNEANITYTDIDLKAGIIVVDYKKSTLFAKGIIDSTGYVQRPIFKQGGQESEQDSIIYNFKSKRALIYGLKTKQGEMFTYGEKTKRVNDSTIYVRKIKFTTSEKKIPDYYIATDKAKLVPGKKIIVGASNLVLADIPTPIFLPFAYFPITETSVSGFLIPAFDTGSSDRGIGFQNGGYYFAINDYMDLTVLGDVYSNGSWGTRISSNYNKRYRFNGSFNFNFENNINGIRGFDDYSKSNRFNIRWSHNQDSKASPNSRFSASVNLGSSKFFKESQNQFNVSQTLTNTLSSSINYSKTFVGTPFNMNLTASHQQNTNTEAITMTLPSLTVNMNRVYPFAGKGGVQKTPIQKMGFNYTMQGQYLINTTDDEFFTSKMFETARSGVQHKTGTNTNIKAFNYFTLSPSASYEETWQFDYIQKEYDPTADADNAVVTDTLRGFKTYREYNAGISLSTNIYGTFNFKKGRLKTIRHTFRPSISYSYRPDFKDKYIQEVQQSADATDLLEYTVFDQGIYGSPSSGLSNSIGISLNNVLEAKVAPKDPDSDEEDEKITLLNNLNFSSSYDITKDSIRWSPVSFSAGTRLFKDKLAVNLSGSLDPYKVVESSSGSITRINEFNPNIFRLTNASLTANYSISSSDFDKDSKNNSKKSGNGAQNGADVIGADINPTDRFGERNGINTDEKDQNKKTKLYNADIPWSINLAYSSSYTNNGIDGGSIGVHSIMFSGNLELSPKWKMGYSSGYDVKGGAFTFSRFNFTRDLDSWQFNFNWVPFGTNSSYTFFIGVKSSVLSDLKWDKNKPPDRTLF
jgi:lipopolysaccharide assembly outer membrane protein LptD (OstA)